MIHKARAVWRGSGRPGNGDLASDSGVLANTPYSFRIRFESEQGTHPEELLAAAHAGCCAVVLAFRLQTTRYTPTELNTEAVVTLEQDEGGFRISHSALTLHASIPNPDQDTLARLAPDAKQSCPVSRVVNLTARCLVVDVRTSQSIYSIPDPPAHPDPLIQQFERWARGRLAEGLLARPGRAGAGHQQAHLGAPDAQRAGQVAAHLLPGPADRARGTPSQDQPR